ncbi:unnamed protein product (macronuclear) [Paramecium tetraurelia]|uniref:Uncharacterized protein n=1 Tax=Paramecium tetraurelia TaxID=5888 RepID=A0BN79_PARTE|nr:uncharacterized protein GSPATT00030634001 [Paramecium tetraurelia]CAK59996.1 unnamed protein product [Paramecium tetraurelia]|eukprot:XP_001427394.1 hypothetical protein (macronuclear) [Paramecium tetraurelia strain d4-2]
MGSTCKNICQQQIEDKEFNINAIKKVSQKRKYHSNEDSKTGPYSSPQSLIKDESIRNDHKITQNCQENPQSIQPIQIDGVAVQTDRKNRFLEDQEVEVKFVIRQNWLQEQEELKQIQEEFEMLRELQVEGRQNEEQGDKHQDLKNQFPFQNQLKQIKVESMYVKSTSNPYLPRQTSQFAPKKGDGDTVSQKSNICKSPTTPLKDQLVMTQSNLIRKSAQKKMKQSREEIASNNASIGTPKIRIKKKQQQQDALEIFFSECHSLDERSQSGSRKTSKSLKNQFLKAYQWERKQLDKLTLFSKITRQKKFDFPMIQISITGEEDFTYYKRIGGKGEIEMLIYKFNLLNI